MSKFYGTGVALVTPFQTDHSPDVPALRKLVQHVSQEGGVDFLVILGTTGESVTLSPEEQDLVIRTILDENAGKLPTALGCGGNNTPKVAEQIREYSEKYAVDGFLSVCPYYNKPTQAGLEAHFKAVCGATEKPVILYNVPGRTSSNLLPATALNIIRACPNALAIKEASGNLEQGMAILRDRPEGFAVLSGDDILTLPMLGAGFDGVISVIANSHPVEFAGMVRAGRAGDFETARKHHYALFELMQLIFAEGNPAGIKLVLSELGIGGPTVRLPLINGSNALREKIRNAMG